MYKGSLYTVHNDLIDNSYFAQWYVHIEQTSPTEILENAVNTGISMV